MPSGHHQVADAIVSYLQQEIPEIECKKIDLLSAWNPVVESVVTSTYLKWIHHLPRNYAWVYKQMAYTSKSDRTYKYYEYLFMNKMKQIITQEQPDLMICTHGFPSYIISRLKVKGQCQIPVINVYTDFFVNDVWGKAGIDYHFVPHPKIKQELMRKLAIPAERVVVTGIPTHEHFDGARDPKRPDDKRRVLVAGGSAGLGNITSLLKNQGDKRELEYFVLCGKNQKLYQKIKQLPCANFHPLPYISSREEMNELYSQMDAIVTKPGGVTISEALKKGLPIFIHSALPGQEEINLEILKAFQLVHELDEKQSLEEQISGYFNNASLQIQFKRSLRLYLSEIEAGTPAKVSKFIRSLLVKDQDHEGSPAAADSTRVSV